MGPLSEGHMSDRATRHTEHHTELDDGERRLSEDRETGHDLVPTGEPGASSAESAEATEAGVHPIAVETAIAAALWFIAVVWVAFAAGPEIDYLLVIVTLFFMMFFTLFLLTASYSVKDPLAFAHDALARISWQSGQNRQRHHEQGATFSSRRR